MVQLKHSRRRIIGGMAAGIASIGVATHSAVAQQKVPFSSGSDKPTYRVPANATDCHFHLYDNRFPPVAGGLAAPDATPADYRALQARLGVTRGVIIQPSLYGVNNGPTLAGLEALGPNFRAVVVVNSSVTDAELDRLHKLGVRGIRFNLAQAGATTLDMLEPLSQRVDALGWHCQINMPGDKISAAADTFLKIRGKLVFDHRAHCPEPAGIESDTYKLIRRLLDQGNTWVKLTGLYADTTVGPPTYSDAVATARAFASKAPTRCVWGTEWPHPTERLDDKPDDAHLLDIFESYVPDKTKRQLILVDNPAELYDFPSIK